MKNAWVLLILAAALGCSTDNDSGTGDFSPDPPLVIGTDERPASVAIPQDYDPEVTYPLLMVLHGRGADGQTQAGYFQLFPLVDEKQFVMIYPDGGKFNASGARVWNGALCCAEPGDPIDDVGYLSDLIEEAKRTYNVDPKRVYLMGHSNGGFMSFRMACEASAFFTAMVSLAGSTWLDPDLCRPNTPPVSVLVVHGTADDTVFYDGGIFESDGMQYGYPGAVELSERSAATAGCDPETTTPLGMVDLVPSIEGEETERIGYRTGCDEGLGVELWTIEDGPHIPLFTIDFADMATDWLFEQSR
ncbi:MAG: prolyl oligopeptidase family serine peptidase [Myxococcales bacterium]|nr:MAG: prolyl oligopeptidase family serine peptidase [Myxococcales bacterium]